MARKMTPDSLTIPKTRETELFCNQCGATLRVDVPATGWRMSLIAVTLANRWKLEHGADVEWADHIPAFCPKHHQTEHYPGHD